MHRVLRQSASKGFSLLEVTIALGVSGMLLSALWQLNAVSSVQREVAGITSQATAVTAAAQNYIGSKRATLLALPALASLGSVARVKITDTDTGATTDSVQSAGYLAQGFTNTNSYGQSFALFVRREDAGAAGVVDANDRLVGLLITTGGAAIPDTMAPKIAGAMGAAGGFIYSADNPSPPTAATSARGSAGGWNVDLSTSWSSLGTLAQAGRLAMLVNLLPSAGGGGLGSTATELDDLTDGKTDYITLYNVFAGQLAGRDILSSQNTGLGYAALQLFNPAPATGNNSALGYQAARGFWTGQTGTDNTVAGYNAAADLASGSRGVFIGSTAGTQSSGNNDRVSIGYASTYTCTGHDITAVGFAAGAGNSGCGDATGSTAIGSGTGQFVMGPYNALVGARIGYWSPNTGSYNSALGYENLHDAGGAATYNVTAGYQAGRNIRDNTHNIMIGSGTNPPDTTSTHRLNIGNQIYGNVSTGQLNLGSPTLISGISLDMGSRTDAIRLPVGTTAQRPVCDSTRLGAVRFNTDLDTMEFCTVGNWKTPVRPSPVADPPVPTPTDGYFVLSSTQTAGNIGGILGAHAYCLNDLTTNDWMGKADAVSRGILTSSNVFALLTSTETNGNLMPATEYYFARAGEPATGGAMFTTDAAGQAPNNNNTWSGVTYFNGAVFYWIGSRGYTSTYFGLNGCCTGYCSNWRSASAGESTDTGNSTANDYRRYSNNGSTCDQPRHLICIVNP